MITSRVAGAFAACVAALFTSEADAASYSYAYISVPGGSNVSPMGINDSGQVTGSYGDSSGHLQGFLRSSGGTVTTLSAPNEQSTVPNGINASGIVVGFVATVSGTPENVGFTYQSDSFKAVDIANSNVTQFGHVNANGQITATFSSSVSKHTSAIYQGNGVTSYLGKAGASLTGINASGEISGFEPATGSNFLAFTYLKGKLTALPVPRTPRTQATGINDGGTVVGFYQNTAGDVEGFVDAAGKISHIAYPDEANTELEGINAGGTIVGNADPGNIPMTVAFSYSGGVFTQISPPECASSVLLTAINTSGQIIGQCEQSGSGSFVGFVATPN